MELTGTAEEMQAQIEKRINELPQDIQSAILNSELGDKVLAIGSAAKLHLDQLQILNDSTMFFMLGFTSEPEFQKEVQELAGGDASVAQKIVAQVNQQILLPIRESLKKTTSAQVSLTPQMVPAQKPSLAEILPKEDVRSVPLTTIPSTPTTAAPIASVAPSAPTTSPTPAPASVAASPLPPAVPMVPKIDMHPADIALTQKTVATPAMPPAPSASMKPSETKAVPPKPQDYKADPYREPIS